MHLVIVNMKLSHSFLSEHLLGSSSTGDENFVENKALLAYSKLSESSEVVMPTSMAVSEFHFLLLIGNKVKVCTSLILSVFVYF